MTAEQPAIRQANADDAAAIAALIDTAFSKYIPLIGRKPQPMTADYADMLRQHSIWLVETERRLAGVLVLQAEPDDLLIYCVAIHPSQQKHGLGRLLLRWAERQAQLAGYGWLRLYTNARMTENIALYTWLGYQETRREAYAGGEVVHMRKRIEHTQAASEGGA